MAGSTALSSLFEAAAVGQGGAATVLSLALDPRKPLRSLTARTTANEVVIGLMAVTLERPN
uniref:hypothetical protein n=1 Tax=uncultured Caulobacter sp. TaxID=158749 RepID=UPI0025F297EF|nr:hypothetical protein [uncultured Caulobacter sp.]